MHWLIPVRANTERTEGGRVTVWDRRAHPLHHKNERWELAVHSLDHSRTQGSGQKVTATLASSVSSRFSEKPCSKDKVKSD